MEIIMKEVLLVEDDRTLSETLIRHLNQNGYHTTFAYTKEETVYSKLNADGENYETIVNAHIKNTEQAQLINDISDLMDIENINGDEEFTKEGENVVWNAEGNDIYYSGNTNKELPLECKVKYELNGEEIDRKSVV